MKSISSKLKWSRIEFKIESTFCRKVYRATNAKPSSAPYLSGDGFRSLCTSFFENGTRAAFSPHGVGEGGLVFCEAWRLREFLQGPAAEVPGRFSIISHNGDPNVDASIAALIPPNVTILFAQNGLAVDGRVIGLPIGLENKRLHYNGITRDFNRLRKSAPKKRPRILSAFTIGNNPQVRQKAADALSTSPQNDFLARTDSRAYRRIASEYMFIASPPGNGEDCHRTWEAMYLRCVPIVLRSTLMESFQKRGLPLLIVDSYADAALLSEQHLLDTYERLYPLMDSEALWLDFWENLIRKLARAVSSKS
jgi:hypothetical protein